MPLPQKPRAILIDIIPPQMEKLVADRRLEELELLTKTYGGFVIVKLIQKRQQPDYRTFVGSGKLEDILRIAREENAELLIINNLVKPKQLFEIEEFFRKNKSPIKVWDRIDLILKIFSKHAKTAEAKLQIKLAAIRHMGPRIFGMGSELMQQTGGIGTRGQGETNTEVMKRHLAKQEEQTEKQLEKVAASRQLHRDRRDRIGLKTVSVVGYTNAGKSTLVNALTNKGAYVANELFATLDTHVGKMWGEKPVLISDTIGFIQDLPPQLVSAFRSTLDETVDADLLLHVIDATDPHVCEKIEEVEDVLKQINVTNTPKIYVFNKIDALPNKRKLPCKGTFPEFSPVYVSAAKGTGLEALKKAIEKKLF
ncbi:MAG: GTPase HflX [Patescibacteria group bacterium]